ncbi:protein NUCLEOLAR FACTOR 1-like isoform X2 [Silene latifolia]|uniref:protein NUCLEOLAR FACTOR 1-like isoform X2 n=1 Tax=Silene latifolia TaxID=37657 RepID=UPI003D77FC4D
MPKRFKHTRGFEGSRTRNRNKSRRVQSKDVHSSTPDTLDDMSEKRSRKQAYEKDDEVEFREEGSDDSEGEDSQMEEDEEEKSEELEAIREPSLYDTLLKKLDSSSKSQENGCEKRKCKDKSASDSAFDEEIDLKGTGQNIGTCSVMGDALKLSEDEASDMAEDDDDVSDAEDTSTSSSLSNRFVTHTTRKLSEQDTQSLLKKKWEYKWSMPALDSTTAKWMGTGENFAEDADFSAVAPYGLNQKLYKHWLDIYNASGGKNFESSKQISFFKLCSSYRDILHHQKKGFYQKGSDEDSSIMDSYVMHMLNHTFKTRDLVTKNSAKLVKNKEAPNEELRTTNCFLDQGFCRPKVLFLLPLASIALRLVRRLVHLTPSTNKVNVEHMDRFNKEFGADVEEENDELETKDVKAQKPSKPSDYQALFGGNNKDLFMVGVKFTRKSIKLYSDFYSSDIIIASPLGLITKIGEAEASKGKDVDYLSSIEILVVDHADVITMQNWSHVQTVVEHLNLLPTMNRSDIMRLRPWYVDGQARFYRQTIILSSYLNPDINALFNQHCLNFEGKLRLSCEYKGILKKVVVPVRQVYERFDPKSIVDDDEDRLQYFITKVFPKIKDSMQGGIMLFISSYFEFICIRNFLKKQDASFCLLSEYTKQSDISRARNWFIKGDRKIMLYTERAHFYHRYKIRGVRNLIVYSLPERKEFYPEILNMLEESQNMTSTVLFSRFDQLRLERIVGSATAKRMTRSEKNLFIFT